MSLDEASLNQYAHYSPFPHPPDFGVEPSTDIIYLDPQKSFGFKTTPDYFPLDTYPADRQSSIDTMASTQSDDMEAFQRLSDQYQPEVAVGHGSIARGPESTLTDSGTIDRTEATDRSIDHRICQRRSHLQNEDGGRCSKSWNLKLC
jgi:hypothetical protein